MSDEELQKRLEDAIEISSFEDMPEEDPDSRVVMRLLQAPDGRHFRVIDDAGMNSSFAGAYGFGEWLEKGEVDNWTDV